VLIALMPLVRFARAALWLARIDLKVFLMFVLISPMYLMGACFWSAGFFQGATGAARARPPVAIESPAQKR
jgi:hypothetical protein